MSKHQNHETSAVLRVWRLPLVRSAMQSVTSVYSGAKDRYPLLGLMGGVAEVGVRNVSDMALRQATPLLHSLEPQIEVANSIALVSLDRLEKNFPILNQSTDEVVGHLKDALFLTMDDAQLWLLDGMDSVLYQLERVAEAARVGVRFLQDSPAGRTATSGLDEVISRLEDATAYYLPLPPTLRQEWEIRVQEYEDDEDEDEPGLWTRLRSLLLTLRLQLRHRTTKAARMMEDTADKVGLLRVLEMLGELLSALQNVLVAMVYQAENVRELTVSGVKSQAATLAEIGPVRQVISMPIQVQQLLRDLQELTKILLQLVVNVTPLYNMLQQPTHQEIEDFLSRDDYSHDSVSRRSSASSLFLKAMDGRPRRRRSIYSRARGSSGPQSPEPPNGRRSSVKDEVDESSSPSYDGVVGVQRRQSATELLLTPLKQFVSQSQKAFEYLSPNSPNDSAAAAVAAAATAN